MSSPEGEFWSLACAAADSAEREVRVGQKRTLAQAKGKCAEPPTVRKKRCCLQVIVSGGQTGADRAGLEAARALHLDTVGWAPVGYHTVDGPDSSLKSFGLKELPHYASVSAMYITRSMRNVDDSDGTVLFRTRRSPGTDKTLGYCWTRKWQRAPSTPPVVPYRPTLVVSELNSDAMEEVERFLLDFRIRKLNVAGHRDTDPSRTWQRRVKVFLQTCLERVLQK